MHKRNVGLDILRIFSMLCIIGLHVINNGGMLEAASTFVQVVAVRFWGSICYCSVNTFAMLTGYLYCKKKTIRSTNLIRLLVVAAAYCALVLVLFLAAKPELFSQNHTLIIHALFPPAAGRYWFITSYVLMFMMIPYINALIHTLSQAQFKRMILILFALLSVFTTFALRDYFKISYGYSPFWLIFCYFVGAYINLYHNDKPGKKWRLLGVFGFNIAVAAAVWLYFGTTSLVQYTSPFMVVNAACLLKFFSGLELENSRLNKLAYSLSNAAFGVYLLHSHILVFDYILHGAFLTADTMTNTQYCVLLIASTIGIYAVCWIAESVRNFVFGLIHIDFLTERMGKKIDTLLKWN